MKVQHVLISALVGGLIFFVIYFELGHDNLIGGPCSTAPVTVGSTGSRVC